MHILIDRCTAWLLRHPWGVLTAVLGVTLVCGFGLTRLHFSNDYRVYFQADNPQLRAYDQLERNFTKGDNVLFVLTPADGDVFTAANLAALKELTEEAWRLPRAIRVDSLANFQHTHADGDELFVEDLVGDAERLAGEDLRRIRDIALSEPTLVNRLVSPTGQVAGINVTIKLQDGDIERPIVAAAQTLAEQFTAAHPDFDVRVTGMVLMNDAFPTAAEHDVRTLLPFMFLAVFAALWWFFGSFIPAVIALAVIGLSNVIALGLAGWFGVVLSPVSVSAPIIILTIAVSDSVHLIAHFLDARSKGTPHTAAIEHSLIDNLHPVLITALTNTIGFATMNFSGTPPFRDLGNIVALGVVAALGLTFTLLPALLAVVPFKARSMPRHSTRLMGVLVEFVIAHRLKVAVGLGLGALAIATLAARNEVNDNFVEYFDESTEFRQATDYAGANLTGLNLIEYALPAGSENGVTDPEYLRIVNAFAAWYRTQPEVVHVNTFTAVMKQINQTLHGDDQSWYRLPDERDLAAQNLLLYELSLPFGLDLNNELSMDKSASRLTVTLGSMTTSEVLAQEERAQDWLRTHAPATMRAAGASPTIMFAHVGKENVSSMLQGSLWALALITVVLLATLRSWRLALLSIVVNVLPAAAAFGIWALINGRVGVAAAAVLSMTAGVVVDDTVHFLSKYRAGRLAGRSAEQTLRHVVASTVGPAMWMTSCILTGGFLVLALSDFVPNGHMGLLSAITIALAVPMDLLLGPALLLTFDGLTRRESVIDEPVAEIT